MLVIASLCFVIVYCKVYIFEGTKGQHRKFHKPDNGAEEML